MITPLEAYNIKMQRIEKLVHGMMLGSINGIVVSGAPGIGKTYTIQKVLAEYGDKVNVTEVKGHITPFSVFTTLMNNPDENSVIILDDADSAFQEIGALNLLKAACDTQKVRVISWLSSANLGEQSFQFKGKVIILTNASLKTSPHYLAILDRMVVYDPKVTLEEKLHKIRNIAEQSEDIDPVLGTEVIDFLFLHADRLKDISIRTFIKTHQLASSIGDDWKDIAEFTILDN